MQILKASVFHRQANVLAPNKHNAAAETMFRGHLLESETYIGGKVEALESGIFRSDLPTRFKLQPAAYQVLPSISLLNARWRVAADRDQCAHLHDDHHVRHWIVMS